MFRFTIFHSPVSLYRVSRKRGSLQILFAETIIFKNGRIEKGKITDQNAQQIQFESKDGTKHTVSKNEIIKVIYHEVSLKEAEKIREEEERKIREEENRKKDLAEEESLRRKRDQETQKADEESKNRNKTNDQRKFDSRKEAILKSALLPGWGQYSNSRKTSGAAFFLGFLASAFYSFYHSRESQNLERDYNYLSSRILTAYPNQSTVLVFQIDADNARQRLDRSANRFNNGMTILLGVYVLNLVDVAFFQPKENQSLSLILRGETWGVNYVYRF